MIRRMEEATASKPDALPPEHLVEREQRVTPLELFFDLVFVFAFTQVTGLMSDNPTWEGVGQGLLVLALVWWAWGAYSWLTNEVDPDEELARIVVFISMSSMLVAALAIPNAFGDEGVTFGVAYFLVRFLHILFWAYATEEVSVVQAVRSLAWTALPAPALIIVAGFLEGGAQASLWIIALIIDFSGPMIFGVDDYKVSPSHFAERFGLIVIIALGESIVAIGIGAAGIPLDADVIVAAVAGVAIAGALWWAYFDVVAIAAERRFHQAEGAERNRIARDSYSYIHLLLIAGIVLLALGIKKTLGHVDEPLDTVPAVALCGGAALYLVGHLLFRWRNIHTIAAQRLVAAVICLALIPLATSVDAVLALVALAVALIGLIAYEALRFRESRSRIRSGGPTEAERAGAY
jgi:low temperature requirement protein LtrA